VLKPFSVYPLWHESESVHHEMEAMFTLRFTFSSIIVRDYMFVSIVSKSAGIMRNGPSSYNETIEVGSFVTWFGVLICST
jgi:hypothetical protein